MADRWGPDEIARLMVVSTGCLCLPIIVMSVMLLIYLGKLTPEVMGTMTSVGVGGGILGLTIVIAQVIKTGLARPQS